MSHSVDLNADMGESFGPWKMGDDEGVLGVVTSANIACGMHAGDWDVMAKTMRYAAERDVGIGAHPGFADLQGFGRQRMTMSSESLGSLVQYQLGAAQAIATAQGVQVRHLKLHGAMANMASENKEMAMACYSAALAVVPDITIMVLANTAQQEAAQDLGCRTACEIFADRAYNDNATLVDRSQPGAVIHEPEAAAQRILNMVKAGAIITESGKHLPCRIDTVCLHGDTPTALAIAKSVRATLLANDVSVSRFAGEKLP